VKRGLDGVRLLADVGEAVAEVIEPRVNRVEIVLHIEGPRGVAPRVDPRVADHHRRRGEVVKRAHGRIELLARHCLDGP
jgi:hypothetical protein